MSTKVSIVIPYWNGEEKVKKYLPAVLKAAREEGVLEIIASDDDSSDKTVALLKSQFPEVVTLARKENSGFSTNVNFAFEHTEADLVVLLNSDAAPKKDFLKYALPHFADSKVFSVGCRVGEGLWSVGKFENGFFWHGQGHLSPSQEITAHQTLWASGGSSIFRKAIWDELGGMDTLFNPFYEEDLDLGYRATKRGYINIWEPKSRVEHYQEKGVIESNFSQEKISSVAQRNQLIFIWKNITSPKLIAEHKRALFKMLLGHPKYGQIVLAAATKLPQIMEKRKIEKVQAKLSDEEIFRVFESG